MPSRHRVGRLSQLRAAWRTLDHGERALWIAAWTATVASVALFAVSASVELPKVLEWTDRARRDYGSLTADERARAFGERVPVDMDIFDFYRANLRSGDRYFVQAPAEAFGEFADKRTAVRSVARLYLLPAVEVEQLADADVVLSWDSDPGLLPARYSSQVRAGLQLLFVSRIARDR